MSDHVFDQTFHSVQNSMTMLFQIPEMPEYQSEMLAWHTSTFTRAKV